MFSSYSVFNFADLFPYVNPLMSIFQSLVSISPGQLLILESANRIHDSTDETNFSASTYLHTKFILIIASNIFLQNNKYIKLLFLIHRVFLDISLSYSRYFSLKWVDKIVFLRIFYSVVICHFLIYVNQKVNPTLLSTNQTLNVVHIISVLILLYILS